MSFQPRDGHPVLWVSARSRYQLGAPIRGGIPICWPWFGPHPHDPAKPAHGFARISTWEVIATRAPAAEVTLLELKLVATEVTRRLWPHAFELHLQVRVSSELEVDLTMHNTGSEPMVCGSALHSYFAVSDISAVRIYGLEGGSFLDTVPNPPRPGVQHQPIAFLGETDRVYTDTEADCVIADPGLHRRIRIAKAGSRSTVVWNPWIAKAARMPDFGDDEWREMLCVETANALTDVRVIPPASSHQLSARISSKHQDNPPGY
jgi:D-hexose-6-phosphate mutarotase